MENKWLAVEKVVAGMMQAMISGLVVIPAAWLMMGSGLNLTFNHPVEFVAVCLLVALRSPGRAGCCWGAASGRRRSG